MKYAIAAVLTASVAVVTAASAQTPPALAPLHGFVGTTGGPTTASAPVEKPRTFTLTISAMAPKRPVLKYSLITRVEDRLRGNAALFFGAAATEVAQIRTMEKYQELDDKLRNKPIAELTAEDIAKVRETFPLPMYWLSHGARRGYAEWPVEITEGVSALLPSLGDYRRIANRLSLEIRWDLHEKRYAEATEKIRIGMTLGRYLADGDTIIEALVGTSVCDIMAQRLLELAQQPDAPNLYWCIAQLPQPLLRVPYHNERGWIYFSLPELKKLRDNTFNDGDWEALTARLSDPKGILGEMNFGSTFTGPPPWAGQLTVLALSLRAHPRAREFYKEQGLTEAQIDAMGARKLIAGYFAESFEVWMDEAMKGCMLPYPEAQRVGNLRSRPPSAESSDHIINPLLLLIPSLDRAHFVTARLDRSIAMIRAVEALRMYAAEHKGALPAKLDDCPVPVPLDPITGKPFVYSFTGEQAVLESKMPLPRDGVRLEITMRK